MRPRERPRAFQPKIAAVSDREGDRLEAENNRVNDRVNEKVTDWAND